MKLDKAYMHGFIAGSCEKGQDTNPYPVYSHQYDVWSQGWMDAVYD